MRNPTSVTAASVLLLFFCVPTFKSTHAEQLCRKYYSFEFQSKWNNRIFSFSNSSPQAQGIAANKTAKQIINKAFTLLHTLDQVFMDRQANNHTETCNLLPSNDWVKSFYKYPEILQLGIPDRVCSTRLYLERLARTQEISNDLFKSASQTITDASLALYHNAASSTPFPGGGNWSTLFILGPHWRNQENQVCHIDSVSAIWKAQRLYIWSSITNRLPALHLPDWERQTVFEWIPKDSVQSLQTVHPRWTAKTTLENATTIAFYKGGIGYPGASQVGSIDTDFDPVSPAKEALLLNAISVSLSEDAVTKSNTAILVLPLLMNLIPISFVADVPSVIMVLYVIITDCFSSVPLLLKGVELIQSATPKKTVVGSFHTGTRELGQLEVWSASCRGKSYYSKVGISFIFTACISIVIGIVIEVFAYMYMRRKRADAAALQETGAQGSFSRIGCNSHFSDKHSDPGSAGRRRSSKRVVDGPFGPVHLEGFSGGLFEFRRDLRQRPLASRQRTGYSDDM